MSIEKKQNFPTYQDSDYTEYPQNEKEVSSFIKKFYKSNTPIELIGSGSKRKIGKPLQCEKTLSLSKISGIVEYLPEELYIKVKSCTLIKEIEEKLKQNKQQLAFEPIDFGFLLNGKSDYGTAAGQVACNISGPRRIKVGSVRDHVLGFRGVNGRGEIIKSGGVVVKNVTGYDLSKLMCGSYGTLVALTEITFKVLPAPEENKSLIIKKNTKDIYYAKKIGLKENLINRLHLNEKKINDIRSSIISIIRFKDPIDHCNPRGFRNRDYLVCSHLGRCWFGCGSGITGVTIQFCRWCIDHDL